MSLLLELAASGGSGVTVPSDAGSLTIQGGTHSVSNTGGAISHLLLALQWSAQPVSGSTVDHTAGSATVTGGTHVANKSGGKTVAHVAASATIQGGLHVLGGGLIVIEQVGCWDELIVSGGTHALTRATSTSKIVPLISATATATGGTHHVTSTHRTTAGTATASGGTHTPTSLGHRFIPHVAGSATAQGGTSGVRHGERHIAAVITITGGTHTLSRGFVIQVTAEWAIWGEYSRPGSWDGVELPRHWVAPVQPEHWFDPIMPSRWFGSVFDREDRNVALTLVAYGPFTENEIPEALLVRVFKPLRAGGTAPLSIFNQSPPYTATVSIQPPSGPVFSRSCEIVDPADLPLDYPDDFAAPEQGWVRVFWQDGDFDTSGAYQVQITLDNGSIRLKSTDVWTPEVNVGPASAVT